MIGARAPAADPLAHQARERGEGIDGRHDALPVQLATEHELPLGDVAGEIGNGVRDVVVGHGEHGDLRHRSRPSVHHPGPLVQRGEVSVHVPGESAAARHFLTRSRYFT